LEYIPGKITDSLDRLIALYRPDSVVVGTRGRKYDSSTLQTGVVSENCSLYRAWQNIGKGTMGSVSRYCLSHSPVPIIVVRPERKVKKAIEKRRADPKRGIHFD
jgi:nucleotide-binding universal stress UspA family protein